MNEEINYQLIFDVMKDNSIYIWNHIISLPLIGIFIVIIIFLRGKPKEKDTKAIKIFLLFPLFMACDYTWTSWQHDISIAKRVNSHNFQVVEGVIEDYTSEDYKSRQSAGFLVKGLRFSSITRSGFDFDFQREINLHNGLRVKIYYYSALDNSIQYNVFLKFWIEKKPNESGEHNHSSLGTSSS